MTIASFNQSFGQLEKKYVSASRAITGIKERLESQHVRIRETDGEREAKLRKDREAISLAGEQLMKK